MWTGTRAIAEAVKLADVDVIAAYPIRPYTGVMNSLAKMLADGEFTAEIIGADSEHSQFEIVKHASAVGARTFAGSSGVGLAYAAEPIIVTALGQLPVVAMAGCRSLDDPGNFGMEWNDVLTFRDQGWLMSWAKDPQEALDMILVAYRVSEDPQGASAKLCSSGRRGDHAHIRTGRAAKQRRSCKVSPTVQASVPA